jgi:hypothetical protein
MDKEPWCWRDSQEAGEMLLSTNLEPLPDIDPEQLEHIAGIREGQHCVECGTFTLYGDYCKPCSDQLEEDEFCYYG